MTRKTKRDTKMWKHKKPSKWEWFIQSIMETEDVATTEVTNSCQQPMSRLAKHKRAAK